MKKKTLSPIKQGRTAFSLVEIVIAVGIAAFSLVVIIGLVPTGVNTNQASIEQTTAVGLAQAVISDLRLTPPGVGSFSPRFQIDLRATLYPQPSKPETYYFAQDGTATGLKNTPPVTSGIAPSRFRVSMDFVDPPAAPQKGVNKVHLLVTWPAVADPDPTKAPTKYSGSYEVVTALDRN